MQKIISLFQRNYDGDRLVRDEIVPGAEWVTEGAGIATRKYDGVCTMIRGGKLYRRFTEQLPGFIDDRGRVKKLQTRPDFEPATEMDPATGKREGWIPVGDGPEDKYLVLALEHATKMNGGMLMDGTYEFLGPKSQGNVEGFPWHDLLKHTEAEMLPDVPRDYDGLFKYFLNHDDIEGVVWRTSDGRMVKVKGKDFGIKRIKRTIKEDS